ncbi:glycoside hydrolase family 75 protein [Streptomyces atratus]|uniref:glycoside hydrolase family 75 protein n=1 Tax=Streptomyces atratus TaxID=1893 RepID=UPI0037AF5392
MRTRTLALAAASGAALLAAATLTPAAQARPASGAVTTAAAPRADSGAADRAGAGVKEGSVSAADLLAEVTSCSQISNGKYRTDEGTSATVPVCGKNGAVFWKADMDIDCDGQITTACNENTDPWFQDDTAFHTSGDKPLNAEKLPYVVVPSSSSIWNYSNAGIKGGGVVAVIYNNKVEYAVVGDTGPNKIIGEASYATAKALGIDPDPETGGAESGVTYILFKNSKVSPIESHSAAVTAGEALAKQFIQNNWTFAKEG